MYEKLLQELKDYTYFCGWKYETRNGSRTKAVSYTHLDVYKRQLDWYSMYAIRYKELVKKDEGINNNIIMAEIVGDKDKLNVIYHQAEVRFKQQYKKK